MSKNISEIVLEILKHQIVLKEVEDIFMSYTGKPISKDILNELEVEIVMHINRYRSDKNYNGDILDSTLRHFYENIFNKLKQQL